MITDDEVISLGFTEDVHGFRSNKTVRGISVADDRNIYIVKEDSGELFIYWRSRSAHENTLYDGYADTIEELEDILTNKLRIKHIIS